MSHNHPKDIRRITEVALSDLYLSIDFARSLVPKGNHRLIAIKTKTEEIAFHLEESVLKISTKSGTAAIIARNVEQLGSISVILRDGLLSVGFNGSRRLSTFIDSNSTWFDMALGSDLPICFSNILLSSSTTLARITRFPSCALDKVFCENILSSQACSTNDLVI